MTIQTDIESLFSRITFQHHTRLELLDDLRVRAPDILELKNHLGTMHGGMLYAVGEVAAAVAMAKLLERDRATLYGITRHGDIAYLKPARGAITSSCDIAMTRDDILCALQAQRSVDVPVTVTLSDLADVVVAKLSLTWYVAPLRR
jgi:acyl-coenzyme A thioesterase PaaI-like protein